MEYTLSYEKYKEALKEGRLLGLKCNGCNACICPPKKVCDRCFSEDFTIIELEKKGTLKTFTVIRVAPEGWESPYIVGMVELDEGPWVMGNVVGIDPDYATMDLMGKKGEIGHRVVKGDKYTGGEGVALTFALR